MKKIFTLLLCLLFLPGRALAHEAIFIDEPIDSIEESYEITGIEESQAIYSRITEERQVDIFTFEGEQGQRLYTQLMVPDIEESRDLLLTLVVFGAFDDGRELEEYTELLGGNHQGYVIPPGNNRTRFFEPFTQTSYFKKQQFSVELPRDGTYYLAVYSTVGQHGRYVLTVGHEENFSITELLQYPVTWFRVNYWFNPLRPFSILVLVSLVIFAIVKILRRGKKKKRFS